MSRPGPSGTANGRADARPGPSRVPRGRAPGAVVRVESEVLGRGAVTVEPAPEAPAAAPRRSPAGAPTRQPVPFRPVVAVPRDGAVPSSTPSSGVADRLPARLPDPGRRLTLVERVTLVLRRLGGGQGRHRPGRSREGWSMFAPHRTDRRRGAGWARR